MGKVQAVFGEGWGYFWGRLDFGGGTFPTYIGSQGTLGHYPRGRSPLCFPTFPKFVPDLPHDSTAFPDHPLPTLAVLSLPLPPNGFPYSLSGKAENPGKLVDRRFPSMPYI